MLKYFYVSIGFTYCDMLYVYLTVFTEFSTIWVKTFHGKFVPD